MGEDEVGSQGDVTVGHGAPHTVDMHVGLVKVGAGAHELGEYSDDAAVEHSGDGVTEVVAPMGVNNLLLVWTA